MEIIRFLLSLVCRCDVVIVYERGHVVKAGRECRRDANESLTDRDAIFGEVLGEAVPVMTL